MDLQIEFWGAVSVAAKLLVYAATFGAAGGALFLLLFAPHLTLPERRRLARVIAVLALLAIILTVIRFGVIVATLGGGLTSLGDAVLVQIVLETGEGRSAFVRIAGLALIPLMLRSGVRSWSTGALGALIAVFSFAFTGHTGSAGAGVIPRLLLGLHLLGVAYWLGALYPLRMLTYGAELPRVGRLMKRFGDIAAFLVGGLLVAGVLLLWILLGSPTAIFDSAYGRLLFAKLMAVAVLLALAALNKFRLTPRLLAGDKTALPRLRRSISFEVVVAGLILALTASFTTLTGPPSLE